MLLHFFFWHVVTLANDYMICIFFIDTVDAFSYSLTSIWCEATKSLHDFFHGSML